MLEQRGSVIPGAAIRLVVTTLSPSRALMGMKNASGAPILCMNARELVADRIVDGLVELDEIHLVDRDDEMFDTEQVGDERMAAGLLQHAVARVDQNDGEIGGGSARRHVARVLLVAGRIGDDELALRRREIAVGDVDGDALLAFGAQAVGEQREIDSARRCR